MVAFQDPDDVLGFVVAILRLAGQTAQNHLFPTSVKIWEMHPWRGRFLLNPLEYHLERGVGDECEIRRESSASRSNRAMVFALPRRFGNTVLMATLFGIRSLEEDPVTLRFSAS